MKKLDSQLAGLITAMCMINISAIPTKRDAVRLQERLHDLRSAREDGRLQQLGLPEFDEFFRIVIDAQAQYLDGLLEGVPGFFDEEDSGDEAQ